MSNQPSNTPEDIFNYIIPFFVVLYAVGTAVYEMFKKKKVSVPLEKEESFEEELEEDEEEHHIMSPPVPLVLKKDSSHQRAWQEEQEHFEQEHFVFHSNLESYKQKSSIDERHLDIHLHPADELVSHSISSVPKYEASTKQAETPIQKLMREVPSKQSWIILSEIVNPPVSLRKDKSRYW